VELEASASERNQIYFSVIVIDCGASISRSGEDLRSYFTRDAVTSYDNVWGRNNSLTSNNPLISNIPYPLRLVGDDLYVMEFLCCWNGSLRLFGPFYFCLDHVKSKHPVKKKVLESAVRDQTHIPAQNSLVFYLLRSHAT
jgi:hypothetical protein